MNSKYSEEFRQLTEILVTDIEALDIMKSFVVEYWRYIIAYKRTSNETNESTVGQYSFTSQCFLLS